MEENRLDVIIFGATGYTGKYAVIEGVKLLKGLTWGVAGRNKEKLESVLAEVGKKVDQDLSKIPIVIADVGDEKSILEMTKKAKIIVNCCGPYREFGEQVVKACVEFGTHHVDVSGETQFIEKMQLKYNQEASEKGIYIVSACGMDSIPAELGSMFLEEKFNGTVNSIETYMRLCLKDKFKPRGARINHGTWDSALLFLANIGEIGKIRRQLVTTPMPRLSPKKSNRSPIHKSEIAGNHWCVPMMGTDKDVMVRTQRHFYEQEQKRPIQIKAYLVVGSIFNAIGLIFGAAFVALMAQFSFTRNLLMAHPKFFTAGNVSHEGPDEETNKNTLFKMTFYGEGWKEKNADDKTPINKKIITKVSTVDPGYGATAIALLISATTILKEGKLIPGSGGVLPPGAAFKKTSMIEQLQKNGFDFEVVKVVE